MRSIIGLRNWRIGAVFAVVLFGATVSAFAEQLTYEGDVVAVDARTQTFTVETTEHGGLKEMTFHVGPRSEFFVQGERTLLAELAKGDHVVVYESKDTTHSAKHVKKTARTRLSVPETGGKLIPV